jgi:hypothetical protein
MTRSFHVHPERPKYLIICTPWLRLGGHSVVFVLACINFVNPGVVNTRVVNPWVVIMFSEWNRAIRSLFEICLR